MSWPSCGLGVPSTTPKDAKGLLKAGIDSFAHGIRDRDIDEELVGLFKARPNVVLIPNMPDRGVAADYSWLRGSVPDAADLVVTDPVQAGVMAVMAVADTAKFDLMRQLKKRY